jgi:hypothetical protein
MKKKTRKKVVRRKRRSMREKRVMKIKRGLMKRAKKLHLGAKRTGAYVYGTLRRIVGNPYTSRDIPYNMEWAGKTVIPRGTRVMRATNLPGNSYWAKGWRGMKEKERSWERNYGFKIEAEDVVSKRPLRGNPMRSSFDKPTFGPGQAEYRRVDTTTMAGIKEAERLQRAGWYQAQVTPFSTTYYRKRALPKSSIARQIRGNPPMYAHRMMSHRTHGLSLRQMMKLYRLVSSGNPKAVMFARRTLGIPMSESLSQVKAVVYHHVLDLKGKI